MKGVFFTLIVMALLAGCPPGVSSARILALFPYIGKSHFDVFEPYLDALAERGHEVVVTSFFPKSKPIANYTDISIKGAHEVINPQAGINLNYNIDKGINIISEIILTYYAPSMCRGVLSHPAMQALINSDQQFDLIITELFVTDCLLGFVHKFKAPFIAFTSSSIVPLTGDRFGNPDNPAYIPNLFESVTDKMTFYDRFSNTLHLIVQRLLHRIVYYWTSESVAREFFGKDLPPLWEIAKNTSLLLTNTHFSLTKPRPFVPAIVEVGGIHIKPAKKLPEDLQKFLDESKEGVVLFSMGSMIRAATFPDYKRQALVAAFSELSQKVIWKWEEESVPDQPKNVVVRKWLPQFDILNHPNVRAFVGHGGLLSTLEAAHCGVPMVGIPIFGDQKMNVRNMASTGMGVYLSYSSITKDNVLHALKLVLDDHSYRDNAQRVSRAFNDRPMSPMDTAIFWTEYVIRHRGAPHLRSAAVDLNLAQYLLLDVLAVLLAGVVLTMYVTYKVSRIVISCFPWSSKSKQKKH